MAVTSCGSYAATSAAADFSLPLNVLGLPSLANTIGAVYVGVVIGTMLFGLTLHQTYRYFQLYPSDGMRIKIFPHFDDSFALRALLTQELSQVSEAPADSVAKMLVTETMLRRFWWLHAEASTQTVYTSVVSMLAAVGFGIAAGIEAFTSTRYITDFSRISWLVSAAYGLAALTDVILTGSLVYVLRKYRTESKRSDSVLYILTVYAINTGNMIYAAFSVVGAKLDDFSACTVEPGASESPRDGGHQARRRDVESLVFAHVVSVQLEEIQFAIEGNAEDDGLNGIGEDLSPKGLATASGSIQNYDVETKPLETSP
ncbi:hypothetical protein C8Q78DRAFT_1099151 [Trametes maxima]|nr:hypothetical protein C8Q78DRAFT_1099151 [Trametes maxima]